MELQQTVGRYYASRRRRRHMASWLLFLVALVSSVTFFFPFFWTATSALKTPAEVSSFPPIWLPRSLAFGNFAEVVNTTEFVRWLGNTAYVTVLTVVGSILSSAIAGYSFARFEFRGRDLLFGLTLATLMLPAQVTLITRYLLFHKLGWLNTFKPLWIPAWFGGGAFNIFLMRQFMMSLPREMDEAGLMDGANYPRLFWSIILPLCKPVLATAAVIAFNASWNNYLDPLIFINERTKMVLAVGIDTMNQDMENAMFQGKPTYHLVMALCTMAIIPPVILFFAAQRYFVQGIVMTGIKG